MVRPEGFEPPIPAFGGLCVIQLRYGRALPLVRTLWSRARSGTRHVLEEVQLMVDQRAVKLAYAIGVTEEIRARVRKIVARRIGNVVREFDLFHLRTIDRMGAEIAREC